MADDAPRIAAGYRLIAALPLPLRRRAVRLLFAARAVAGSERRRKIELAASVHLFQRVLRLSRQEALRLDREARLHDLAAETEWLALHRRSLGGIRRDMAHVAVQGSGILERVAGTGRPVILAPLHMGAYVMSLACTTLRFFPGRPLLILRRHENMPMETAVMERIREFGVEMRFLNVTARADFLAAVRFAQNGAVVVVFCDLPPAYGAPAEMPMFGMPFRFAFGLDALARLTGATVVPWVSTMRPDGDTIAVGRPFEVTGGAPEDRAQAAAMVRGHIRDALRAHPEQWHHWPMLAEYLPKEGNLEPASPEDQAVRSAA